MRYKVYKLSGLPLKLSLTWLRAQPLKFFVLGALREKHPKIEMVVARVNNTLKLLQNMKLCL